MGCDVRHLTINHFLGKSLAVDTSTTPRNVRLETSTILTSWQDGTLSYTDAVAKLNDIKAVAVAENRPEDQAYTELRRGVIEGYRGNYGPSIEYFERARDLFLQSGARAQVLVCNVNIGETYRLKGNFSRARQYFRMGYESAVEQGNREVQVLTHTNEAQMLLSQGHPDQAEAMLLECYDLSEQPFVVQNEGQTEESARRAWLDQRIEIIQALTQISLENDKSDSAWRFAREAYTLAQEVDSPLALGFASRIIAQTLTQLGNTGDTNLNPDPDVHFLQAIQYFKEINAEGEIARTLYLQGRSLARRSRNTMATRKLHQAVAMFSKLGMVDDAAKAAEEQLKLL
jgi:tetratricopeptide (TPR) repeat protein